MELFETTFAVSVLNEPDKLDGGTVPNQDVGGKGIGSVGADDTNGVIADRVFGKRDTIRDEHPYGVDGVEILDDQALNGTGDREAQPGGGLATANDSPIQRDQDQRIVCHRSRKIARAGTRLAEPVDGK